MVRPPLRASLFVVAAVAWLASPAGADLHLTYVEHTDASRVGGERQPARDETVEIWLGDGLARRDSGNHSAILRREDEKLLLVDHAARTFHVLELPIDLEDLLSDEQEEQLETMEAAMASDFELDRTGKVRRIGGWSAELYRIEVESRQERGPRLEIDLWATRDVPCDRPLLRALDESLAALQPGGDWMRGLAQIDGLPVRQEVTLSLPDGRVRSREELTAATVEPAADGRYEVPAGYRELPFAPLAGPPPGMPPGDLDELEDLDDADDLDDVEDLEELFEREDLEDLEELEDLEDLEDVEDAEDFEDLDAA